MNANPMLEQLRAQHAWETVMKLAKDSSAETRTYDEQAHDCAVEAKKLPMRMREAGLGASLAFLASKSADDKKKVRLLLERLGNWVLEQRKMAPPLPNSVKGANDANRLLLHVIHGNAVLLRTLTSEIMAYLVWLNRFLEAENVRDQASNP